MSESAAIGQYQPLLYSIALRMVGSLEDAEDIVQDTYLKWLSTDRSQIQNTKSYLVKAVTNNCINHLNNFKKKRDSFFANIQSESLIEKYKSTEFPSFDLETEISEALAVLHKKLEPMEKAVFLLREVFELEYDELTELLDQKKENCRQMLCRARQKLQKDTKNLKFDMKWNGQFAESFRKAANFGKFNELVNDLSKEIEARLPKRKAC